MASMPYIRLFLAYLFAALFLTPVASRGLPVELSKFIPGCALECFNSFISVNFLNSRITTIPSLKFLCSHPSASGLTLGEGAIQCISAEVVIGFCPPGEVTDSVLLSAYSICDGQRGAIMPTHQVITATMIIPTTAGVVTVPPIARTTLPLKITSVSTLRTLPTTLVIDTSAPPSKFTSRTRRPHPTSTSKTTTLRTRSTPSSTASSTQVASQTSVQSTTVLVTQTTTSTSASSAIADKETSNRSVTTLSKGQVAGVSIGVVAAAALAVGAILLARSCRKKRQGGYSGGFLPIHDSWVPKPKKSSNEKGRRQVDSWIGPQIPRSPKPVPPLPIAGQFARTSLRPEAPGLFFSPAASHKTGAEHRLNRQPSKLLPAKPTLTISYPENNSPPFDKHFEAYQVTAPGPSETHQTSAKPQDQASRSPPGPLIRDKPAVPSPLKLRIPRHSEIMRAVPTRYGQDSTVTEFEEDGSTFVSPAGQIWKPPPSAGPLSATTYYVSDKNGNWVLGDPRRMSRGAKETDSGMTSWTAVEPRQSRTIEPEQQEAQPNKHSSGPPASLIPGLGNRADKVVLLPSQLRSVSTTAGPDVAASVLSQKREASGRRISSAPPLVTQNSSDSDVTDIAVSDESSNPSPPVEQPVNLSPVVELPTPSPGQTQGQVVYPKIRDFQDPTGDKRLSRPHLQVNRQTATKHPTSDRALRLSRPDGIPRNGGLRLGPVAAQQPRVMPNSGMPNPGLVRNGSPTMRMVDPSPEPEADDRVQLPSGGRPRSQLAPPAARSRPPLHYGLPHPTQRHWQPPHPYHRQQAPRHPSMQPQPHPPRGNQGQQYPQPNPRQYQHPNQHPPHASQPDPTAYRAQQRQSNRLSRPPPAHQPNSFPWRPPAPQHSSYSSCSTSDSSKSANSLLAKRLGNDRAAVMSISTAETQNPMQDRWHREGAFSPAEGGDSRQQQARRFSEAGPYWMPKLTPTRRGDDLILNVQ